MMVHEYHPPLLDVQEILSSFRESQIDLNESDLSHPDPRKWREIYTQIFTSLTGICIEQATQSVCRQGMMTTHDPEIFEEGFAQLAFTLCMQRVFHACGFKTFSVRDVISPTPKRVLKIASAYINMARHRNIRNAFIADIKQSVEQLGDEYEAVLWNRNEFNDRLGKVDETKQQMDMQKSQEEYQDAEQRLMELSKQQEVLRKSVEDLNVCLAENATKKDHIKQLLSVEQQESEKLSSKIFQSPERFKQDQERLKKRIMDLESELTRKEQIVSENRQLLEQNECKRLTAERAVKLSREVQDELGKNEFSSDINRVRESHNELSEIHNHLWAQEEDLAEKLAVRLEQKRKLNWQKDVSKTQQDQKLAELKQHLAKQEEELKSVKTEVSQIKQEIVQVYDDISNREDILEEKKQAWKADFTNMLNEIDVLHTLTANGFATFRDGMLAD